MAEETEAQTVEAEASEKPSPSRRKRRGDVRVFGQWCKGCRLCIAFCPRHVFAAGTDGRPLVLYPERCTACLWCTEHCPDFAIVVTPLDDTSKAGREAA